MQACYYLRLAIPQKEPFIKIPTLSLTDTDVETLPAIVIP